MFVYVHVCGHECHFVHVEVGGQYDGISFFSIMWVPGTELINIFRLGVRHPYPWMHLSYP